MFEDMIFSLGVFSSWYILTVNFVEAYDVMDQYNHFFVYSTYVMYYPYDFANNLGT